MSALMTTLLTGINHSGFILTTAAIRSGLAVLLSVLLFPTYGVAGIGFAVFSTEALALAATLLWFVRRELEGIGGAIASSIFSWSAMSSGCVVVYLITENLGSPFANSVYWLALVGAVVGSMCAWRQLGDDVKMRLYSLIGSGGGFSKLDP